MTKEYPVKCPLCEEIRQEPMQKDPKIMLRIYCNACLEKLREEGF